MQAITITQITAPELEILIENSVKRALINQKDDKSNESDRWLDINELCNYLSDKPARSTVYGWVHTKYIPYHKGGKKLRFLKSEIDIWLSKGKRRTLSEIAGDAVSYLQNPNKK